MLYSYYHSHVQSPVPTPLGYIELPYSVFCYYLLNIVITVLKYISYTVPTAITNLSNKLHYGMGTFLSISIFFVWFSGRKLRDCGSYGDGP